MKLYTEIEKQISIAIAVGQFLRAENRAIELEAEALEARSKVEEQVGADQRYVVKVEHEHYLLTTDEEGHFDIEPVKVI